MNTELQLLLENEDGTQTPASCTRFAVIWQGKEIWVQTAGNGQLLIGVDVEEGDAEYANLLLRPLATNLVSLQLEMSRLILLICSKKTTMCIPTSAITK